jgi:hypothetical protein
MFVDHHTTSANLRGNARIAQLFSNVGGTIDVDSANEVTTFAVRGPRSP